MTTEPDRVNIKIKNGFGVYLKREDGLWWITDKIKLPIYLYESLEVEEVIKLIRDKSVGVENPRFEIQDDGAYGDVGINVFIIGSRTATEKELVKINKVLEEDRKRQIEDLKKKKEARQNEVAEFIKRHPELEVKPKGK
jgi:hypothetical protein